MQTLRCSESDGYVIARYPPVVYPSVVEQDDEDGVGWNIVRARKAAGFKTQTAFAQRLGVPQPQLSDWENGRYGTPDVTTLLKIAAAIPCSIDELVRGVDLSYDKSVIARAKSVTENNPRTLTFPGTTPEVKEELPEKGGSPHAETARHRVQKSTTRSHADQLAEIRKLVIEAIDRLSAISQRDARARRKKSGRPAPRLPDVPETDTKEDRRSGGER